MRRKRLTANGASLSYLDSETSGHPVLFLHGLAGQASEWAEAIRRLPNGFRAIALDQRGHGATSKGLADFTRAAFADDAAEVLPATCTVPAFVVGQSMGGLNAIVLAARYPTLVRGLVAVEADVSPLPGVTERIGNWLDSWPLPFPTTDEAVRFFGGPSHYASVWTEVLERGPDGWRPNFRRQDMLDAVADMETVDRWADWRSVRCAALLVAGGAGLARRGEMQEMAAQAGARYVEIVGAGHDLHLQAPDACAATLNEFLSAAIT